MLGARGASADRTVREAVRLLVGSEAGWAALAPEDVEALAGQAADRFRRLQAAACSRLRALAGTGHGGRREGSGRPLELLDAMRITARIPGETFFRLERFAADTNISRSEAVRRLLAIALDLLETDNQAGQAAGE